MENNTALLKELKFDEGGYINLIQMAESDVVPFIEYLINAYKALGLDKEMDQDLLLDIYENGCFGIKKQFVELTKKDMAQMRSPIALKSAMSQIDAYMEPLETALEELKTQLRISRHVGRLSIRDFLIVKGKVRVNKEQLKKRFIISITNEKQAALYQKIEHFMDVHNDLRQFVTSNGVSLPIFGIVGHFVKRNKDGDLELIPESILSMK